VRVHIPCLLLDLPGGCDRGPDVDQRAFLQTSRRTGQGTYSWSVVKALDQRFHEGTHTPLTAHALRIPGSGIREIFNLALGRDDVLHLEVGEPDFAVPQHVVDAAFASARGGSGYTATTGVLAVRAAAATRLHRVHGIDIDPSRVLITQGGVQAIAAVMAACVSLGDEVLIPDPGWPNYEMMVVSHGGVPVRYPLRASSAFVPDPDEVARLVTERTKVLVVNTPANPTGAVLPDEELERLVAVASSAGVVVLSDEVYDEIVFDGRAPQSVVRIDPDRIVGVWSCSKTYAMTGWRVGCVAVPEEFVVPVTGVQESMISCVSSVTQAAALAAFEGPQDCVATMRDAYQTRRDVLMKLLDAANVPYVTPGGAFYLMLLLAPGADGRAAALDLVTNEGVAVAPGTAFGETARSALRISLAASETTIAAAAERMTAWYARTDGGLALQ
jgi:aspartate/methionine/tyrosine aminotransferase